MKKGFFRKPMAYALILAMLSGIVPAFAALAADEGVTYADGTYVQSITVEPDEDEDFDTYQTDISVTVEGGKITAIAYVDQDSLEDNEKYANWAMDGRTKSGVYYPGIAEQVVETQSTEAIDAVTGATCSSTAILEGVNAALLTASAVEDSSDDIGEVSGEGTTDAASNEAGELSSDESLYNGDYTWSITVTPDEDEDFDTYTADIIVTFVDGTITSIVYADEEALEDNATYANWAMNGRTKSGVTYAGVASQIIASQSTDDIDAVTGATCSSTAIVEGVAALLESLTATGETTTEAETTETSTEETTAEEETTTEAAAEESTEETTAEETTAEVTEEADTSSLEALIDALSYYTESDYTSDSWSALQTVLAAAQAMLADTSTLTQDGVDAMVESLAAVVILLEESVDAVSGDDSSGSSTSTETSSTASTESSDSTDSSSSTSTTSSSSTTSDSDSDSDSTTSSSTETGDSTNGGFYAGVMISVLCGIGICGFVVKKEKEV